MSQYLHLRGFTGRPSTKAAHIAAHGVNPALQSTLGQIPAITLSDSYRLGDEYQYADSFKHACYEVLGSDSERWSEKICLVYRTSGSTGWMKRKTPSLAIRRSRSQGAREIIAWFDGDYRITDEIVQTQ